MSAFTIAIRGRFSLDAAQRFLGGFTPASGTFDAADGRLLMAFPVDGWQSSVGVEVWQDGDVVRGQLTGSNDVDAVGEQVARTLSLDHDADGWEEVGERDAVIGRLQRELDYLRPVCFYSPYEAAAWVVLVHRVSMAQAARAKAALAHAHGEPVEIAGVEMHAFPSPQRLLEVRELPGLPANKLPRLHTLAEAALEGSLDADWLRSLAVGEALAELRRLPGIGEWSAQHVLLRGAGTADVVPTADPRSRDAIRLAYELPTEPDDKELERMAEPWRPFRTWAFVLLRAWYGISGKRSYRHEDRPRPARSAH